MGTQIGLIMATQLDRDVSQDNNYFQNTLPNYYRSILKKFHKLSKSFIHFNIIFFFLFFSEIVLFTAYLPFINHSSVFALSLCSLFVTSFSYIVLLFYFQAKKPEQMSLIKEDFITSCRKLLSVPSGTSEHHLSIAAALSKLSRYLQDFEWEFYKIPTAFQFCSPLISRFSAYCYWEDVFKIKQMLLLAAIDEHIKQIRITPTDLEVHASLGGTYVTLSKLYRKPIDAPNHPKSGQLKKLQERFEEKSKIYSRLAMEEFKILSQYASDDPWVHEQMALGYKDLNIPEEEIKEIEILHKLKPQDREILFRLGSLYFAQGLNAKGLIVYEELRKAHFNKAEELIASYGTTVST
jgi:hypothetical protein